jgi:hypothetical protein
MLSRTERIDDFHLKVSRTEKDFCEEFLETNANWAFFALLVVALQRLCKSLL